MSSEGENEDGEARNDFATRMQHLALHQATQEGFARLEERLDGTLAKTQAFVARLDRCWRHSSQQVPAAILDHIHDLALIKNTDPIITWMKMQINDVKKKLTLKDNNLKVAMLMMSHVNVNTKITDGYNSLCVYHWCSPQEKV